MTLKEKIEHDLIEAMKAHDENKLSVLRMLKSSIKNSEIQKQKELEETDVLQVIQTQIKSRKDSIDLYTKGGRPELAEKEESEIKILTEYLPEQLSEEAITTIMTDAITKLGASGMQDMGKVMGEIMPAVRGKADPSLVSQIVKTTLLK
ncbi:MAG: GatB/YqeY domain-containing protein [Candidatus Berkelbacteria bacterium]